MSSAADLTRLDPDNPPLPVIFGVAGERLSAAERDFIATANPLGFILFARNCVTPDQVRGLVADMHEAAGRTVPVLIDQEGGRVQRLKPPHWPDSPAAEQLGHKFLKDFKAGREATVDACADIAETLAGLGITVNCAPVLDVLSDRTDKAIGDRAFSDDPDVVAVLGGIACRTYLSHGVIPVVKHLPGLGRAALDTHHDLAAIETPLSDLERIDLFPYRQLLADEVSGGVWGMVGHATYNAIDPGAPASCSLRIIQGLIRDKLGFDNLLLSDDIDMGALSLYGDVGERTVKALSAGCDVVLQCDGDLDKMKRVADRVPPLTKEAAGRFNRACDWLEGQQDALAGAA